MPAVNPRPPQVIFLRRFIYVLIFKWCIKFWLNSPLNFKRNFLPVCSAQVLFWCRLNILHQHTNNAHALLTSNFHQRSDLYYTINCIPCSENPVTVPQCAPLGGAWYEKEESEPGEEQENAESGKQHERTLIQTRGTFWDPKPSAFLFTYISVLWGQCHNNQLAFLSVPWPDSTMEEFLWWLSLF